MLKINNKCLLRPLLISFVLFQLSACSSIISSSASNIAEKLSYVILNSDDPKTIADGAPAYLLLMDSFLVDADKSPQLLQSAATLYSAYAGIFVSDPQRAIKMSNKALSYAQQALCISDKNACQLRQQSFTRFGQQVSTINKDNLPLWYTLGAAWAGWIKANSSSVSAIAQLPRVNMIMMQIVAIDENWQGGQAHLYLGVLNTLLPPALGGKPEQGQYHFKRAILLSENKNLMAKVLYAEKYARLIFDQKLHDQLLHEVIQADTYAPDLTLMNTLAQQKARQLLASSADYF